MRNFRTSRRAFLHGVGACIAVPAMESLIPNSVLAADPATALATTATGAPLRTAFLSFPNGAIPQAWWPTGDESSFNLSTTLKPLDPVRQSVQILKGLDNKSAVGGNDGPGDHARGNSTLLTGVRLNKSATDIRAGQSIDQAIASQIGHLTRFPSLELASDPIRQSNGCDSGYSCAYQYNISWQSETTPMSTECNPRLVFERLFGSGMPRERANNLRLRRSEQQSILDYVLEDARAMQTRMQRSDRRKLDEYLTGVRELERRIQRAESFGDPRDPGIDTPAGIPRSQEEYVNLMYELAAIAFQTDSTRIVSLMLGHDGDNRSYDFIGVPEGHHELSHHQGRQERIEKIQRIDKWYVSQFARFLTRLDEMKDVDGNSILHNSMVLYGSGNADGNRHTHDDLPILFAGAAGGKLKTGRFIDHDGVPLTNLFLSIAQHMGVQSLKQFGDSDGLISNL